MSDLPHLRLENTHQSVGYTYAGGGGGGEFKLPARDPSKHHQKLKQELEAAQAQARARRQQQQGATTPSVLERKAEGFVLTFVGDTGYELKLESLDRKRPGIELVSAGTLGGVPTAKVYVPEGGLVEFLKLVEQYATPTASGKFRNAALLESINSVRLALVEDFWEDSLPFPLVNESVWWEVWLRGSRPAAAETHLRFKQLIEPLGVRVRDRFVTFPERVVVLAYGTGQQLSASFDVLTMMTELRRAKELAGPYLDLTPREEREIATDLLARLTGPPAGAPAVVVLDWGVDRGHPLLAPALAEADAHAVEPEWGTADDDKDRKHGTGMAGIALYGCLTEVLTGGPVRLRHRLESVKILPPPPGRNEPDAYGAVTQIAATRVMLKEPHRTRVYCMAVTSDDRDHGLPSSWSGAVDEMCAGVLDETPKLMVVSAGNIREHLFEPSYRYHESNCTRAGVEDPAQAWNVLTVGAFTEKVGIQDPTYRGYEPIAERGDLSPTSRTSLSWREDNHSGWPIKPDVVMEGGNYAALGDTRSAVEDLSLLTTRLYPTGRLFDATRDTSPATAAAARLAAILWSHYPRLRPETVRALLVHSARWTTAMTGRFPGDKKSVVHQCLRCYGYGVPDMSRALYSAENAATLLFEGELRPFRRDGAEVRTNEMHLHALPWPKEVLERLGATEVTMRVTLSYFVEPSPGRVGWGRNHRYASHGLRFDVIRPYNEDVEQFKRRISRDEWDDPKTRPEGAEETRNWVVGDNGRTHGSLHCDWWTGTAADLAQCGHLAVYPVTGWWRERAHLGRCDRPARYSLVVSIETPRADVDLYHAITAVSQVATEVLV